MDFLRYKAAILLCIAVMFVDASSLMAQDGASQTTTPLLKDVTPQELQNIIDSYKGEKAVLVNVWATWCAPCIEEFPEIVKLQRNYQDQLKVIFVSADFENNRDKALDFLKKQKVNWTTYFKTGDDQKFIESLSSSWTGALPFSKVIAVNGEIVDSWEQSAGYETFEKHVKTAINR